MPENIPVDPETTVLAKISAAMAELDDAARARVWRWVADKFQIQGGASTTGITSSSAKRSDGTLQPTQPETAEATDLASFYDSANPQSQSAKALVVAYWLQVIGGTEEWESQAVNTELKNLGHGLKNVTDTLNTLIEQTPRLVIQTRKSGSSKQARKKYKITVEGIRRVKSMLAKGGSNADDEQ